MIEIRILRSDHKVVKHSVFPNISITGVSEANSTNVLCTGKTNSKAYPTRRVRQVLIKQKLHALSSLRSFSAAKAGQARISSSVSSGSQRDLLKRHSSRQVFQHVGNGDTQAAHTRVAATFSWFNGDDASVIHLQLAFGVAATTIADLQCISPQGLGRASVSRLLSR